MTAITEVQETRTVHMPHLHTINCTGYIASDSKYRSRKRCGLRLLCGLLWLLRIRELPVVQTLEFGAGEVRNKLLSAVPVLHPPSSIVRVAVIFEELVDVEIEESGGGGEE